MNLLDQLPPNLDHNGLWQAEHVHKPFTQNDIPTIEAVAKRIIESNLQPCEDIQLCSVSIALECDCSNGVAIAGMLLAGYNCEFAPSNPNGYFRIKNHFWNFEPVLKM